jgi:hypothetical protein
MNFLNEKHLEKIVFFDTKDVKKQALDPGNSNELILYFFNVQE